MPVAVAGASTAEPATVDDVDGIDQWVEQRMAAHQLPGAAVAVVRGGEVMHRPARARPTHPPRGHARHPVSHRLARQQAVRRRSGGVPGAVEIHHRPDALERRPTCCPRGFATHTGRNVRIKQRRTPLLAASVQQVIGRSFTDELDDRAFDPLEMTGSLATANDQPAGNSARITGPARPSVQA